MTKLSVEHKTKATAARCWEVLSEFGNIAAFNPGVRESYLLDGSQDGGLGAMRQCNLVDGKNYIRERITDWQEGAGYTVSIFEGTMPLKDTFATLRIAPEGAGACLKMQIEYTPKFGLLGKVLDVVMLRRMMRKNMCGVIEGLGETSVGVG